MMMTMMIVTMMVILVTFTQQQMDDLIEKLSDENITIITNEIFQTDATLQVKNLKVCCESP